MSRTAIEVRNISKLYHLGTIGYGSLKDDLQSWWAHLRGKEDPNSQIGKDSRLGKRGQFWALRNTSFDVEQGDRVAIIGRNGAGKSTLLKILSQITAPTEGVIRAKGKIASLLEVGTGFHPELTGRENIFLNGAILGMKRGEIQRKFDEIVEFAGVSQFVDTPVKRYSSGMYVRLGFSVAAHLDSDILIVDEVLAVGDAEFQRKCLSKMQDLSQGEGRTILFVSHNIDMLRSLCNRAVLMNAGTVEAIGSLQDVERIYYKTAGNRNIADMQAMLSDLMVSVVDSGAGHYAALNTEGQLLLNLSFRAKPEVCGHLAKFGLGISNERNIAVADVRNDWAEFEYVLQETNSLQVRVSGLGALSNGKYTINFYCESQGVVIEWLLNSAWFVVEKVAGIDTSALVLNVKSHWTRGKDQYS